jgi:hypothetical protein
MKWMLLVAAGLGLGAETRAENKVITCEIRFVEAPRGEVNRLMPATTYELNADMLHGLQQLVDQGKAVVRGQARLVTTSGVNTQVNSSREFIYQEDRITHADGILTNVVAGWFRRILTRDVGVIANCTPTVMESGNLIHVDMTPERSEAGDPPYTKNVHKTPWGSVELSNPIFYGWSMVTSTILRSGTTVVVGLHDAVANDHYIGTENVVLVLLTATVQPVE